MMLRITLVLCLAFLTLYQNCVTVDVGDKTSEEIIQIISSIYLLLPKSILFDILYCTIQPLDGGYSQCSPYKYTNISVKDFENIHYYAQDRTKAVDGADSSCVASTFQIVAGLSDKLVINKVYEGSNSTTYICLLLENGLFRRFNLIDLYQGLSVLKVNYVDKTGIVYTECRPNKTSVTLATVGQEVSNTSALLTEATQSNLPVNNLTKINQTNCNYNFDDKIIDDPAQFLSSLFLTVVKKYPIDVYNCIFAN